MRLYAFSIFLKLLSLCLCKKCTINNEPAEVQVEVNLRHHLVSCSDSSKPPVKKNTTPALDNTVVVKMEFLLQSFKFDLDEETITLHSWNYFDWQDDRLQWNPEDYSDIKKTVMSSFLIWSPGLKLVNTVDAGDFDFFYTKCNVNNTGHVRCALRAEHTVICQSTRKNWPYDTKICLLEFDQWRPGEVKVIFNLTYITYVIGSYETNGWEILRGLVSKNLTTGVQSTVKFSLQRLAEGLETTIVVPSFVIAALTVQSLFFDYKHDARLGMICFCLISHFAVSNEIDENIPKHTPDTPVILLFISGSTVLTIIVLVITFVFRFLGTRKNQPPAWISNVNDFILDSYGRYLIVEFNVANEDLENERSIKDWNNFISIVNSVCLFIVIVTYICLFATLMPKKTPLSFFFDTDI